MTHSTVNLIRDLFVHREDVYGEQWINTESGDSGYTKATIRRCPDGVDCGEFRCEHREILPLTNTTINDHLIGRRTLGVYQLGENDTVKWLCLDIDKDKTLGKEIDPDQLQSNAQEQVRLLVKKCLTIGLKPAVEDSGNRGYHVWVFFNAPIPAALVQAIGFHLVNNVRILPGLHIEVFPKQVSSKSLGNLVKLPLGVHLKSKRRSTFVNRSFEPMAQQVEFLRNVPRHTEAELRVIVDWYNLKVADNIRRVDPNVNLGGLGRRVPLCLSRLMSDGVGDGMRDVATFKLACYLRDRGFPEDLAMMTLEVWNERNKPPLTANTLNLKVVSAYSDAYGYLPCFEPAFDTYCSDKCEMYSMKMERRGSYTPTRTS
jgi:hypothetical protein